MTTKSKKATITVQTEINAPVEKVWIMWTDPKHIVHWNNASDDWYTPEAQSDLRVGGRFNSKMSSKDGKNAFDFSGEFTHVEPNRQIEYTLDDDRKVSITFVPDKLKTRVIETFEAEETHSLELQHNGWQAILDNFKNYVENTNQANVMHFKISINAPVSLVYKTMINDQTYREWTAEFNPTSYFLGSWEKGSDIKFLGVDKDGKTGGMVSRIKENIPNKFISIEHLTTIIDGVEVPPDKNVWSGYLENYSFEEEKGMTVLSIDVDSNEEFESYFNEAWPRALKKLKSICESNPVNQ